MTGTLTIAARELRERSFVFVTAAVVSLVPFAAALPSARSSNGPLAVIMIVGTITAVGFTIALAAMLGGSMVARELAEKRLSFYFSKPVPASAIWFGKLAGAIAILALCYVITFTPSLVVAHSQWRGLLGSSILLFSGTVMVIGIFVLLLSHCATTMVRSRSPFVALDLSLLVMAIAAVRLLIRPLMVNGSFVLMQRVIAGVLVMVPIVILAGGAWQLSRGRTDIRRSHRQLSTFVWSATAIVLLVAGGYVAWIFAAGPHDITIEDLTSNSRADWVAISGPARCRGDYRPAFVVDVQSGRSLRLSGVQWTSQAEFTRGGDAVVFVAPAGDMPGRGEVHLLRLRDARPDEGTGIMLSRWSGLVASDDLRRLATYESGILSIHDLPSKTQLASVRIPSATSPQMFFVSDDVVRIYARAPRGPQAQQETRIYEFNAKTRQIVQSGSFKAVANNLFVRTNADGSTLVVNQYGGPDGPVLRLLDGRTGAERGVIRGDVPYGIAPLRDGGVALIASKGGTSSARILDAKGHLVADVPLGTKGVGRMIEVVPGRKYIAAISRGRPERTGWRRDLYIVDTQHGIVEHVERNYVLHSYFGAADPRTVPAVTGEYIIVDAQNTLWRWNALTGAKVKVL